MRTTVILLCSLAVSTRVSAQSDDPKEILSRVRTRILQTVSGLPKYMCTQTIDRADYARDSTEPTHSCGELLDKNKRARLKVTRTDRLRLDVAIGASEEIYSWVGEDRFDNGDLFRLVHGGALQTGAFSGFLASIFGGSSLASFFYNGDTRANDRTLMEFGFEVPREKSTYLFGDRHEHVITGYGGTLLVDPQTLDLVGLVIRTEELPPEVKACQATTTLDYSRVRLNGDDFLLPKETHLEIVNIDGSESENRTIFSACHEFLGESTLSFSEPPVEPGARPRNRALASDPLTIPAGLPFTLVFTQPIDTASAAAGDRINAKLTSDIRDASSRKILVPKGSSATARIMKIESFSGPPSSLIIAVKLESVEFGKTRRPLAGTMTPNPKRFEKRAELSKSVPLGSLDRLEDPGGVFEFRNTPMNYVVTGGLQSMWTTVP
jgi:hypothetical protein